MLKGYNLGVSHLESDFVPRTGDEPSTSIARCIYHPLSPEYISRNGLEFVGGYLEVWWSHPRWFRRT